MINLLLAEPGSQCTTFLCDYVSTQFDPAHLLSELGFSLVFELLQLVLIVWLWRRVIKPRLTTQIHTEVDQEHGIVHHNDHVHQMPEDPCDDEMEWEQCDCIGLSHSRDCPYWTLPY